MRQSDRNCPSTAASAYSLKCRPGDGNLGRPSTAGKLTTDSGSGGGKYALPLRKRQVPATVMAEMTQDHQRRAREASERGERSRREREDKKREDEEIRREREERRQQEYGEELRRMEAERVKNELIRSKNEEERRQRMTDMEHAAAKRSDYKLAHAIKERLEQERKFEEEWQKEEKRQRESDEFWSA